jgi:plastocyanin
MRKLRWWMIGCAFLFSTSPSQATSLQGTFTINGKPAEGAIVYLESAQPTITQTAPTHIVMDQKNLAFVPTVLPVVRGAIVEFTNSDNVLHNVFSPSANAGKFDLGAYSQGEKRSVSLHELGEVLILCNIHMEMEARILVLPEPYFAVVEPDGGFQISEAPAGAYVLKIWRDRFLPYSRSVTIPANGEVTLLLQAEQ